LDPFVGGMIAVAEACRNVSCTGAEPIALTDCLNFGNPEKLDIYYQLEEAVKGIAEAGRALGVPVISGNVSLYNESQGTGIYPTPVIGALGLLEDVRRHCGAGFRGAGDTVVLLGSSNLRGDSQALAGSEYLELVHGLVAGQPALDLVLEASLQKACRRLVSDGVARSAHDCSDGGLAVTLAESCIAGDVGLTVDAEFSGRWDAALFGETQSRIVVSLAPADLARLERICSDEGVPWVELGTTGGDSLGIAGLMESPLAEMRDSWQGGLIRALEQK
ncbi:MAG: phosphoribosylformylglycinamidine synthase II, partial [Chloroflexi bacterium]|nr:phosphoribosylformylglycinamidine synthase II [Chloroflexota bacterium]